MPHESEQQFHQVEPIGATTRTLQRGLTLLAAILDAPAPPTLTRLASDTGLPKATVSRLLGTLVDEGFAIQLPGAATYSAGPALARRMRSSSIEHLLIERGQPVLEDLRDLSGETAVICTPTWPDRICVAVASSAYTVRAQKASGEVGPLTRGCTGRAFLAFADAGRVDEALAARPLVRGARFSITDPAEFRATLAAERAQGYALSWEGTFPDMSGIAAPVFGDDPGMPIAIVSVSGPSSRWTREVMTDFAPTLLDRTARLSRYFGRTAA